MIPHKTPRYYGILLLGEIAFIAALLGHADAHALAILNYYEGPLGFSADVVWSKHDTGTFASAEMVGDSPYLRFPGTYWSWQQINGGIAFLDISVSGSNLEFATWDTDTFDFYDADHIDIFALPIQVGAAFAGNVSSWVASTSKTVFLFSSLPGNENGFRIFTEGTPIPLPVPDASNTILLLGGSLLIVVWHSSRRRQWAIDDVAAERER